MKVNVKVKSKNVHSNQKVAKKPAQNSYVLKDCDADSELSAQMIQYYLKQGMLPPMHSTEKSVEMAKAAIEAFEIQHYLCRGMLPPMERDFNIFGNHNPSFGFVIIH